ncbi:hypothetical protein M9H77_19323 [Catharanthus roseus]|uniref:Uncharacterized protein n=1 Tax=Catharanthus roseus TaxID=4058 RepID=A0ACC0B9Y5_CATRO|nr:hypothetical protein M9H77_19323 [Catharanthus roseus]
MVPNACDAHLDQHRIQLRRNDHTYWETQHASHIEAWYQWRLRVRDDPVVAAEVLSYPSDEYIRWYRGITRVYIGNLANRDSRSYGYQPAGVDRRMMTSMLQEVDDMTSVVIQQPTTYPSQMAMQGLSRCTLGCTPSKHDIQHTFPVQPSHRRPREHVPDRGARGVKRGARRLPGCGAGGGRPPIPPIPHRHEHVDPGLVDCRLLTHLTPRT